MEFLSVIAAAVAAFVFGAVWYIAMSKPWMAAPGVTEEQQRASGSMPYVVGLAALLLVAGMMRHLLGTAGVTDPGAGAVAGFGIGSFLITPWVAMNYAFGQWKPALTAIDGVNSVVGCAIMGAVLKLFWLLLVRLRLLVAVARSAEGDDERGQRKRPPGFPLGGPDSVGRKRYQPWRAL